MSMSATRLILCRHGESEGNRDGRFGGHGPTALTERGRAQAQATGLRLRHEGADAIYCSDLVRARETAELIGQPLSLTPELTPALRERSVGIFTGLSFAEARARACAFLDQVLARHAGQRVIVVSHYLTVHLLVLHIMGVALTREAPRVSVQLHNCGLHRFELYDDGAWQVLALNDTAHLSAVP